MSKTSRSTRRDSKRSRFCGLLRLVEDDTVHAYCLMGNHFHLVVETPQGNLVAGMKWFLGIDTGRFNRGHKHFGHLFSGRYKALSERKKTDRQEVAIARRLRGETVMTAE